MSPCRCIGGPWRFAAVHRNKNLGSSSPIDCDFECSWFSHIQPGSNQRLNTPYQGALRVKVAGRSDRLHSDGGCAVPVGDLLARPLGGGGAGDLLCCTAGCFCWPGPWTVMAGRAPSVGFFWRHKWPILGFVGRQRVPQLGTRDVLQGRIEGRVTRDLNSFPSCWRPLIR